MNRAFPVERLWRKNFFSKRASGFYAPSPVRRVSSPVSLDSCASILIIHAFQTLTLNEKSGLRTVSSAVHRFQESIAGRPYLIEVAAVSANCWRAYIVRLPGVPTALMPFYGPTPDEAASLLRDWLRRAHERAAMTVAGSGRSR
jgi:hypothetical protein